MTIDRMGTLKDSLPHQPHSKDRFSLYKASLLDYLNPNRHTTYEYNQSYEPLYINIQKNIKTSSVLPETTFHVFSM
jgi:hypothetical protein